MRIILSFTHVGLDEDRGISQYPHDATELSRPESTTILGAAKIVGRTEAGTSFGIMEAVTAPRVCTDRTDGRR